MIALFLFQYDEAPRLHGNIPASPRTSGIGKGSCKNIFIPACKRKFRRRQLQGIPGHIQRDYDLFGALLTQERKTAVIRSRVQTLAHSRSIAAPERSIPFTKAEQTFKMTMQFILSCPFDGIPVKKCKPLPVGHLLTTVDHRHAVPGTRQDRVSKRRLTHPFVFTATMGVFIMIGGEIGPERARRPRLFVIAQHFIQAVQSGFLSPDRFHLMQKLPGIGDVEYFMIGDLFAFSQPEQFFLQRVQLGTGLTPEVQWHQHGHIAAKSIDITLSDPESHRIDHCLPHRRVIVIQVYYIIPAMGVIKLPLIVFSIETVIFARPPVIPSRVVGYPVDDDAETQFVGGGDELFKVGDGTVFRIGGGIIGTGVVAAQASFSTFETDGMDRHEPEDLDSHIAKAGQLSSESREAAFPRILSQVDFINIGIGYPIGTNKWSAHNIGLVADRKITYILLPAHNFVPLSPIMKTFNVPIIYRSPLITAVKNRRKSQDKMKKDFTPTKLDLGGLHIYLARHFGFCYGVENAIEISFRTVDENPGRRIFLLSEMIHNPQVNADLQARGITFLQDTGGRQLIPFDQLSADDIVIIPAFGTTLEIEQKLQAIGIATEKYNTTCPFVEKVWNRSSQIAKKEYSIVVHGKPGHEETRATFSHAAADTATVVVKDMEEARILAEYIKGDRPSDSFYSTFKGQYSEGFDVTKDLERIGVVNQTTMLASDTQAIADFLKQTMMEKYGLTEASIAERFADTRDTLCYATLDNQSAVMGLLDTPADLAIVVGGYNSSNTSHLVELCEEKYPTYFINSEEKILSSSEIQYYDFHNKGEYKAEGWLPEKQPVNVLITSGASCPDALVEGVIRKIAGYFGAEDKIEQLIKTLQNENAA